jgi:Na+/melibiose symporter-like transporter
MCGGPAQPGFDLLWFSKSRGLWALLPRIGIGGMLVPAARWLNAHFGWHLALLILGMAMIAIAFPMAWFVKENPEVNPQEKLPEEKKIPLTGILKSWPFYLLVIGSMCSIGAVSGTSQNLKLFFSLDLKYSQGKPLMSFH